MELWKTEFEEAAKKERKRIKKARKERLANKKKQPKRKVITKLNHIETRAERARKKLEAEGNLLYKQMRQVSVIIENLPPLPENDINGTNDKSVPGPVIDPVTEDIFNRISRSSVVVPADNNIDLSNLPVPTPPPPQLSSPMTGPTPPAPPPPVLPSSSPAPPPPPPVMQVFNCKQVFL